MFNELPAEIKALIFKINRIEAITKRNYKNVINEFYKNIKTNLILNHKYIIFRNNEELLNAEEIEEIEPEEAEEEFFEFEEELYSNNIQFINETINNKMNNENFKIMKYTKKPEYND